ncbi:MAG TPA: hypothetical protein VK117_03880 [Pyrinomonadaceae bacterium]|nr:hypothetical protein [Pyrinomonadaceae bacterium]
MKNSLLITLILLVTLATNTSTGYCQQPNPSTASPDTSGPDAHALKIRHQLEYLGFGRDVTVRLRHGRDYHGRIVDTGDDSFRLDEVDLRKVVSISYSDTRRIDAGYMEKSLIGNTRHNPHTSKIISLAAIAGLAVIIGVVVHGIK